MRHFGSEGRGPGRGPGWGRGGGQQPPSAADAAAWIAGALPDEWFVEAAAVTIDRDEILIIGTLAPPPLKEGPGDAAAGDAAAGDAAAGDAAQRAATERGRISRFREDTRDRRIAIALQLEARYLRKVSWGVTCGETTELFTTFSAPVMTRLRQPERQVLDTLVDSGVARSRSEALAWCVRLVGDHADQWLAQLRDAMGAVDELRRQGPEL
jgi:hypothetical protein